MTPFLLRLLRRLRRCLFWLGAASSMAALFIDVRLFIQPAFLHDLAIVPVNVVIRPDAVCYGLQRGAQLRRSLSFDHAAI